MAKLARLACDLETPLLDFFELYAAQHKGSAPYIMALDDLARFLGRDPGCSRLEAAMRNLTSKDAMAYKAWSMTRPGGNRGGGFSKRAPATTNMRINIYRGFYRAAIAEGLVDRNPWDGLRPIAGAPRHPTKAFSAEQLKEMLEAAPDIYERALLSTLLGGGLRRAEAAALLISDVQDKGDVTTVRLSDTKNGDPIFQPMPTWAATFLRSHVAARLAQGATASSPLFVFQYSDGTCRETPLGDKVIAQHVKAAAKRIGLKESYGAHSLRASFVTQLLTLGVDRKKVLDASRLHSYEMVDRYDKRMVPLKEHAALKFTI